MSQPIIDFKIKPFIEAAEELLRADETLRALDILNGLPAYYRENIPPEIQALKREIQSKIATASFYATSDGYELTAPENSHELVEGTLRGILLLQEMKELNKQDLTPHLHDLAPGEYAFVRMLASKGCIFTYEPSFVNWPSYNHYKKYFEEFLGKPSEDRPKIYFGGEILEHLHDEAELRYEMERKVGLADVLHFSTPNMTYDYNCTDWRSKGDLGHLRTYTAPEFQQVILKLFPEYHTQVFVSQILHARCVLKTTKFNIPQEIKS